MALKISQRFETSAIVDMCICGIEFFLRIKVFIIDYENF